MLFTMSLFQCKKRIMITAGKIINTLKNEGLQCFLDGSRGAIAKHLSDINNADENSLTFYTGKDDSVLKQLAKCIVIVDKDLKTNESELTLIKTNHPKLAFYIIAQFFAPPRPIPGIASTAVIHPSAKIDKSAYIGENSVIENCEIGPNTVIHNNVVVYENSIICKNGIESSSFMRRYRGEPSIVANLVSDGRCQKYVIS